MTGDKVEVSDLNPLVAEFVPQVGEVDTEPADPSGSVERDPTLPKEEEINSLRRRCNFEEDGDDHEMYDDYYEHQRSECEEMDWQQHEHNRIEDDIFVERKGTCCHW